MDLKNFCKRAGATLLAAAVGATLLAGCGGSGKDSINVLTYEGYFPDNVVQKFTEETGIKWQFTAASSNEEMYDKLRTSPDLYDIVLCGDYMLDTMIQSDMLLKLDKSKVTNYGNLDPAFMSKYYDPSNEYTVPYAAGSPVLIWNPDASPALSSFSDLWDASLADKVVLLDDIRVIQGFTAQSLGYDLNETDAQKLEEVKNQLIKLKPNIKLFDSNTPHNALISGDAAAGFMFCSQAATALAENPDLQIAFPSEGAGFGIDCIAIPAAAPNVDNAYAFLNFILEGENSAMASEGIYYISCNQAADAYLSDAFKNNEAVYPPAGVMEKAQFILSLDDATTQIYTDNWTAFKNS